MNEIESVEDGPQSPGPKLWRNDILNSSQRMKNSLNNYRDQSEEIRHYGKLFFTLEPIFRVAITYDEMLLAISNDKGEIRFSNSQEKVVSDEFVYKSPNVIFYFTEGASINGISFDSQNQLWVSTEVELVVLNLQLSIIKSFSVKKNERFNVITQPLAGTNTLVLSQDMISLIWFSSNFELVIVNTKSYQTKRIMRDIMIGGNF